MVHGRIGKVMESVALRINWTTVSNGTYMFGRCSGVLMRDGSGNVSPRIGHGDVRTYVNGENSCLSSNGTGGDF